MGKSTLEKGTAASNCITEWCRHMFKEPEN